MGSPSGSEMAAAGVSPWARNCCAAASKVCPTVTRPPAGTMTGGRLPTTTSAVAPATAFRESMTSTAKVQVPAMAVPSVSTRTQGLSASAPGSNVTRAFGSAPGGAAAVQRYVKAPGAGLVASATSWNGR